MNGHIATTTAIDVLFESETATAFLVNFDWMSPLHADASPASDLEPQTNNGDAA